MQNWEKLVELIKERGAKAEMGELYLMITGEVAWDEDRAWELECVIADAVMAPSE